MGEIERIDHETLYVEKHLDERYGSGANRATRAAEPFPDRCCARFWDALDRP